MRLIHILASLVFYISLSSAWPWPANLFIRDDFGQLTPRQDGNKPASSAAPAPASTVASGSASQTAAPSSGDNKGSAAPSSSPTGKPDESHNSNNNKNQTSAATPTTPVTITQAEAGGIQMLNPASTTTTYYRIGDNITLAWNYTSLAVTPTAVDVLVSIQSLGATYTLATNMSVNATGSVVWNTEQETGNAGQPPPGTDKYTLAIYDAGNPAGPTQTVGPGILGVWDQFTFAMYTSQPYQGTSEGWQCVTCNGAMSNAERQTLGVIFTMAAITVMSFTWFSSGFLSL